MITIENDMGDILARFDNDAEAERFEKAVDLLEKPLPLARRNPKSDAIQRIIESVQPSIRNKGLEEIITRINQAVFGVNEIKLTGKVAAFIDFFFENRSGDLDPNFFFTLAAFNRSEIRTIFSTLHKVRADMESPGWTDVSVRNFHDATPILQAMYVAKHLFPLKLSFDKDLDGPSSDYALNMYRVCGAGSRNKYPEPTTFNTGRDLYQSTPLQIAHINLAIKLLSIPAIVQALSPEVTGQNLAYSNARLVRDIVKPKWEEPLNELFSSALMTQIGISPEMWSFAQSIPGYRDTGWATVGSQKFSTFEGFYSAIIGLSTILAKSGGAFDEIQSRDLGLSKAVDVISKEAFGSERLKAKDIYELYIARNPDYMERFGVGESYIHWVMPLFIDMWSYESRPSSSNPSEAKNILEVINLITESIDDIADYCAGDPHPLLQPMGDMWLSVETEDLDANSRLILLRQLIVEPVSYNVGPRHPLYSITDYIGYGLHDDLRTDFPGLRTVLEVAKDLGNKLPEHRKLHEAKGSVVNVYALEKYNPLNLFVGHSQVSNCCIYPGSQGFSCGKDAFYTSASRRGKIHYLVQTSLMLLAYNPKVEQFVGSNWAWVPSNVNVPYPGGKGDETEEIHQNGISLGQMIVLDQFELSVWSTGSEYGDRQDVDDSIAEFMTLSPTLFSGNPFGYILAGMVGYTEDIVKEVYRNTFFDLTFRGYRSSSPVKNIVTYKEDVYSDISDFAFDVKPFAYPPNANLEVAYSSDDIEYYRCAICKGECDDPETVDGWVEIDSSTKQMLINMGGYAEFLNQDKSDFAHEDCTFWCDKCNTARPRDSQIDVHRSRHKLCTECSEQCESCGSVFIQDEGEGCLVDGGCTACMRYCDHCEEYVDPSDIVNALKGTQICVDCYEKRDACSSCGTKEYEDYDLTEIEGRLFCEDCVKTCEDCNDTRTKSETVCGNCYQPFKESEES